MIDSTIVHAHPHAAGEKGGSRDGSAWPVEGRATTKIDTAVAGRGNPLRFVMTPGQASEYTQAEWLLAGFPAHYVIVDKGYDSQKIVEAVERSSAQAVIPPRACVKSPRTTDVTLYAARYCIECCFNRLKHYRTVEARYATRARKFASLIYLAASVLCMN